MYLKKIILFTCILFSIECKEQKQSPETGENPQIQFLNNEIQNHPFEDSLYFLRARYTFDQNGYPQAIRDLEYAIQLDSLHPEYFHLLADAYLDNRQSYDALKIMHRASNIFPRRVPTLLKLAEYQHILKQFEASLKTTQIIQSLEPLNAESYFMGGLNHRDRLDTAQAIVQLQQATSLDDRHSDAWIVLGQLLQKRDKMLAMKSYENAVRVDTTNIAALHSLAGFLQDQGKYVQALDIYQKIIELEPTYSDAFVHTGLIYFSLDSFAKALNAFDILCSLETTNGTYYYYRGNAKEAMGNPEMAKADYQQALQLNPKLKEAQDALDKIQ